MPAVQIDFNRAAAGRRALWVLLLGATLVVSSGILPALGLAALALVLALGSRCRRRATAGVLHFDGRNWWLRGENRRDEILCLAAAGYCNACLVSLRLVGERRECSLLVWRWQLDRESWRRLRLAARYGVNTVSTASAAISG